MAYSWPCGETINHGVFQREIAMDQLIEETGKASIEIDTKYVNTMYHTIFKNESTYFPIEKYSYLVGTYNIVCVTNNFRNSAKIKKCRRTQGTLILKRVIETDSRGEQHDTIKGEINLLQSSSQNKKNESRKVYLERISHHCSKIQRKPGNNDLETFIFNDWIRFDANSCGINDRHWNRMHAFCKKTAVSCLLACNKDKECEYLDNIEDIEAINKKFHEHSCSWLGEHKNLPCELTRIIGQYLIPLPYLIFEKGDLCIKLRNSFDFCYLVARRIEEEALN